MTDNMSIRDQAAEVLRGHRTTVRWARDLYPHEPARHVNACSCGWQGRTVTYAPSEDKAVTVEQSQHQADALAAAGLLRKDGKH